MYNTSVSLKYFFEENLIFKHPDLLVDDTKYYNYWTGIDLKDMYGSLNEIIRTGIFENRITNITFVKFGAYPAINILGWDG